MRRGPAHRETKGLPWTSGAGVDPPGKTSPPALHGSVQTGQNPRKTKGKPGELGVLAVPSAAGVPAPADIVLFPECDDATTPTPPCRCSSRKSPSMGVLSRHTALRGYGFPWIQHRMNFGVSDQPSHTSIMKGAESFGSPLQPCRARGQDGPVKAMRRIAEAASTRGMVAAKGSMTARVALSCTGCTDRGHSSAVSVIVARIWS